MRRSVLHRLTALLIAGAFGLGSSASAAAQLACPHHAEAHGQPDVEASSHGESHVHRPGHVHAHGPGHEHAPGHAQTAENGSAHGPTGPAPVDHEGCNCVGPCQSSAAPAPSAQADEQRAAATEASMSAPVDRGALGPRSTPYFLPFANGPPAVS